MPDNWHQTTRNLPARVETAAVQKYDEIPSYLSRAIFTYDSWQDEAWEYWRSLGEANQAIGWTAASLSRIRLTAAELVPGGDEPEILVTGAAADIMGKFCGGNAGQGMFLEGWGYQGGVPGEGWLVVEREDESVPLELATWRMMPTSAVRRKGARGLEIRIGQNQWRPLVDEGFAYKIFKPDPQHPWKAWSPMQAALPIMRRIDLIDRRIVALMVSRLAMNGLLIIPQEGEFAVPERYKGKGDQALAAMLIETATQNIKMPGAASAAIPIIIRYAAELIEKWRLLTWPDVLPAELLTEREQEIKRLATTLSVPLEVITGIGDMNHWCTTADTEILTRAGWKTYDQLNAGEEVLTLNHHTGLSEWQPVLEVNTWEVVDEPMVEISGRRHSSMTTTNHRWPLISGPDRDRIWSTSAELATRALEDGQDRQRYEHLVMGAICSDIPLKAKYSDALVEMVAWYYTEGTKGIRAGRKTPQVLIAQSTSVNPDNCSSIEHALTTLYGPCSQSIGRGGRFATPESVQRNADARRLASAGVPIKDIAAELGVSTVQVRKYLKAEPKTADATPRWMSRAHHQDPSIIVYALNAAATAPILEHAPARVVSREFIYSLTRAQLELFIDISVKGDGYMFGGVTASLSQKDSSMCDAFELAGILVGRSPNRRPQTGIGRSAQGPRLRTQELITLSNRMTFAPRGRNFNLTTYTGVIWCPTTPNGTWYARRDGVPFFTGNSAWNLEESAAKRYVAPAAEILTDGLTVGFLHPLLKQMGEPLVGPKGGKIIVWYDVSELTTSPDKSQHAKDAYDRFEINGAALRRESGLDETDAPTEDELKDMALKKLLTQPATATQALKELTGVVLQAPASGAPVNGPDGSAGQSVNGQQPSGAETKSAPNTRPTSVADRPAVEAGVRAGKPSPRPRVFNGLG